MEQIESQKILIEKDGKQVECDLLFTFDSPDTGKAYMAYTDYSKDDNGLNNIYVYSYDPVLESVDRVIDSGELEMTQQVIEDIRKELHL